MEINAEAAAAPIMRRFDRIARNVLTTGHGDPMAVLGMLRELRNMIGDLLSPNAVMNKIMAEHARAHECKLRRQTTWRYRELKRRRENSPAYKARRRERDRYRRATRRMVPPWT
jgi:hypothetical protein